MTAVFVCTGLLHLVDPDGIQHYGLSTGASYLLGAVEITSAVASLLGFAPARALMLAIALAGGYMHIVHGESSLLFLPTIPVLLLAAHIWANRPQAACSCAIGAHP